ncbi:MAG: DNA recombination protein RmuC [Candidatus Taylorbacteria bacterium]|nr:DNA recombination protein RmuC [Candidatus Taylorbacteria bacterium]
MQTLLIILVVIALIVIIILAIALFKRKEEKPQVRDAEILKPLLDQMNTNMNELSRTVDRKVGDLTRTMDTKIQDTTRSMQDSMRTQLSESSKLIKEVTQGLTKLDETNRQVISFADQLENLQDILKNPKHRGILGEYYLETLLKNVLAPGQFQMQYAFKNGEIVDAVVFVKEKIIPIDSKFSLENYNWAI